MTHGQLSNDTLNYTNYTNDTRIAHRELTEETCDLYVIYIDLPNIVERTDLQFF